MNINNDTANLGKVALITGGAKRVGRVCVTLLHSVGMTVVIHYHSSGEAAMSLKQTLEKKRANSVFLVQGDLLDIKNINKIVDEVISQTGRLDILVNNASSFYPTKIGEITEQHWDDLLGTNLKAPLFLSQACASFLRKTNGCIINMADIHANRPLKNHTVYCIAKAGSVMLTKSLARELTPVRVNAIAPGAILWPESGKFDSDEIIRATALKRSGEPMDIAKAVLYLATGATYTTGQVLTIDGGRTLSN